MTAATQERLQTAASASVRSSVRRGAAPWAPIFGSCCGLVVALWLSGDMTYLPHVLGVTLIGIMVSLAVPRYQRATSCQSACGMALVTLVLLSGAAILGIARGHILALGLIGAMATMGDLAFVGIARCGRKRPIVLVGSQTEVLDLVENLGPRDLVVGVAVDDQRGHWLRDQGIHVVPTQEAAGLVKDLRPDRVIAVSGRALDGPSIRELGWDIERAGAELVVSSPALQAAVGHATLRRIHMLPVRPHTADITAIMIKGAIDRTMAALLLVLLALPLIAVMIAIRLDSSGPAIFRQSRVGRHGNLFTIFKFRTMSINADSTKSDLMSHNEASGPLFKMQADPRVTRLGRFLRKSSIDELPQLINVLNGTMSLVGPRPHLPHEVAEYTSEARGRLMVKPGLTGLWQVSGRSTLSWEDAIRLDLSYVENWTLLRDLSILTRTFSAVTKGTGAY